MAESSRGPTGGRTRRGRDKESSARYVQVGASLFQVPEEVTRLGDLKVLLLSDNLIMSLPAGLSVLTSLGALDASKNCLTSLPKVLSRLSALHLLNLSGNKILWLPFELYALTALVHLFLAENTIEYLSPDIGCLKRLRHLDLSCNRLSALPAELSSLADLCHLDVSSNPISRLPQVVTRLNKLETLVIEHSGKVYIKSAPVGISQLPCWSCKSKPSEKSTKTIAESLRNLRLEDIPDPITDISDTFLKTALSPEDVRRTKAPRDIGCPEFLTAKNILSELLGSFPQEHFDPYFDRCFCISCFETTGNPNIVDTRGSPPAIYILPAGWSRLGLSVDHGFVKHNKVFETWHNSFHGTNAQGVKKIIAGGKRLLKPGDVPLGGGRCEIQEGHIANSWNRMNKHTGEMEEFNPNNIFTSPSIIYSSDDRYAVPTVWQCATDPSIRLKVQFVFQTRQRPGSYTIGQETFGNGDSIIDPNIPNSSLEYYTEESPGILVYGILVKMVPF